MFFRRQPVARSLGSLRERRARVESRLEKRRLLHTVSAARFQLRVALESAINEYVRGDVLEAGAGHSPYHSALLAKSTSITTLDIDPGTDPDIVGDVQDMNGIHDSVFDSILSTQVLEHIPRPRVAFHEFARVLAPGGILVLSAPHLSMVHEAPHDYLRFTSYALRDLCESSGLEVIDVRRVGGLLSFIGHLVSLAFLSTMGAAPGLFWPVWAVNYALLVRTLSAMDHLVGLRGILPRDHVLIARHP